MDEASDEGYGTPPEKPVPNHRELNAVRAVAANAARTVTKSATVVEQVVHSVVAGYLSRRRAGVPRDELMAWAKRFGAEEAQSVLACRACTEMPAWALEYFPRYLDGDDDAFTEILHSGIGPYLEMLARVRWPHLQVADAENCISQTTRQLWQWWLRRPANKPQTPLQLLAYAARALQRVVMRERRQLDRLRLARNIEDVVDTLAAAGDGVGAAGWLAAMLSRWSLDPPLRAPRPLRALLPDIAEIARTCGGVPSVEDLVARLRLPQRTAERRRQELVALLVWAANAGELAG